MLARSTNANDAPMSGFCESVCNADACARSRNAKDARMLRWLMRTREGRADVWILRGLMRTRKGRAGARILAKACVTRMLARSTNANGSPMCGYCAGSCARVKSAPTSGFCESVCDADTCARSRNAKDARMLRWLMRTREGRADERILRKRV